MQNEYFKEFTKGQKGDYIFWIASALPLVLWIFLILKYYVKKGMYKDIHPYTNFFLLMPFIGIFFNIFLSVHDAGPTLPVNWGFCLSTKIPQQEKEKGVVGLYDYTCYQQQNELSYSYVETYINRLYYINYILLFLVIIIQSNFRKFVGKIKRKNSILLNLLCISALLGILGSLCPLFIESPIFTYIALRFFTSILWMSSAILIIFLLNMYSFSRHI